MNIRFAALLIALPLLAGCASTNSTSSAAPAVTAVKPDTPVAVALNRERLVGWWYGDQPTKEGGRVQWLMRRAADGTFRITFRTADATGRINENTEVGEWGLNGKFIVALTKGWVRGGLVEYAPSGDSYYWDVYEILEVSPDALRYRSVESQNEYAVKRVPIGFTFPR